MSKNEEKMVDFLFSLNIACLKNMGGGAITPSFLLLNYPGWLSLLKGDKSRIKNHYV